MLQRQCLVVTMVALCSWSVRAEVIFVDGGNCPGPGDGSELDPYCSIQTAIDAAVDTDEIVVAAGTYFETVNFLGKAITLGSADGPEVTTIDGTGNFHVVQCVSGEGLDTVLDGFTVTGGNADGDFPVSVGGGMFNDGSSPTVTNCTFSANSAVSGGGMYNLGSNPSVTNCTFSANSAVAGGGMYNNGSNPAVTNCTFSANPAVAGGGMFNNGVPDDTNPTVAGCTFSGNSASDQGGGMYSGTGSHPTVTGCTFEGNIASRGGGMLNLDRTTVIDCLFVGNTATGGIQNGGGGGIHDSSRPIITNCTFVGNHARSGGGMEINKFGGSNEVIPVTNCTFITNTADDRGGGLLLRISQPNGVTVTNCIFDGNAASNNGGGMYNDSGAPVVTNCTYAGNTAAEGGGMYNSFSRPKVTNCVFAVNSATSLGGGIFGLWFNITSVTNCTFSGNTSDGSGGAMYFLGSDASLVNCSFNGNSAAVDGGTLRSDTHMPLDLFFPSSPTLINCVVWDSRPDMIVHDEMSTTTALYSDVRGGWPGAGNIDVDPMFVDPAGGDLRLMPGSPGIDAGSNWAIVDLADTDLDGNPRFADDPATADTGCGVPVVVDMGAFELPGIAAEIVFADLNGDGFVGVADLRIVNGCIGSSDPDCCIADVDLDDIVGLADRDLVRSAMVQWRPVGLFGAD